ncbi:hypothetical protein [Clostridium botulinum]|uniref:hypothetical protein n=1 Tax=Clostridium botulinum TaxID=1491 RepID=UPI000A88BDD4|nr:hypothetical protein [Clostridium botulinum]
MNYEAFKDLKGFHEAGGDEVYHDTDYFYYKIKMRDILEIGSEIYFKQKELYVREYEAYRNKEEIIYKYKLCRKNGVWQTKLYNSLLNGASIEGKILAVKEELVKIHLNIDENQSEEEAFWFKYAPLTTNIMYAMPSIGESVRLYLSSEGNEEPIVTGCVRKNGDTCEGTSNTKNRYFQSEHGSEIEMLPGALNIKGGSKEPLSINFEDEAGVTLTSPTGLNLNAGGEIVISTKNTINISAQSQILMTKGNTENGVSIEGEFHIRANNVIKNGSSRESYAPFAEGGV